VQYCQSEQHINDLTGGWTDTSLTELGRKPAERISNRIANEFQYDEYTLISSDLIRAKETAEIISKKICKNIVENNNLREINNGIAAGMSKVWANENRNKRAQNNIDLDFVEFKNAETWRQFYFRISKCMDELTNENKKMIIVTHGFALSYIMAWWMRFEPSMLVKVYFKALPGSISRIQSNFYSQNVVIVFNDCSHLHGIT
jgi:probable phosphoglycerate mutase